MRSDSGGGEPFDIVSHKPTRDIAYDGDWERQQRSQSAYRVMVARDEHRYEQLLQVNTAAMRPPASVTATLEQEQVTAGAGDRPPVSAAADAETALS